MGVDTLLIAALCSLTLACPMSLFVLCIDRPPHSLLPQWKKALYRGYTDASFNNYTQQPETIGVQGPMLRAEVSDMVQILFRNSLTNNYASMHSMGLSYG